jgi:hypothetical protein
MKKLLLRLSRCVEDGGTIAFYGCSSGNDRSWLKEMIKEMPNVGSIKGTTKKVLFRYWPGSEPWIEFDVIVDRPPVYNEPRPPSVRRY